MRPTREGAPMSRRQAFESQKEGKEEGMKKYLVTVEFSHDPGEGNIEKESLDVEVSAMTARDAILQAEEIVAKKHDRSMYSGEIASVAQEVRIQND